MRGALAAVVALIVSAGAALAADAPGSFDPAVLGKRFPGSVIIEYKQTEFDQVRLLSGVMYAGGPAQAAAEAAPRLTLEGRITRADYEIGPDRTALEVARNYDDAFKAEGFEILFSCSDADCGARNFALAVNDPYSGFLAEQPNGQQYILARKARPEGDAVVAVYVVKAVGRGGAKKDFVFARVTQVELKPMTTQLELVSAEQIANDLTASGVIAIYGVLFAFDKADILPESKPALDEIAKFLAANPAQAVYVVGHTDGKGTLSYNLDLSKRRAQAVVDALARDYAVSADRLQAHGLGPLSPAASNATESGQAKNRRVEIVAR